MIILGKGEKRSIKNLSVSAYWKVYISLLKAEMGKQENLLAIAERSLTPETVGNVKAIRAIIDFINNLIKLQEQ